VRRRSVPSRALISTLSAELIGTFLFIAVGGAAVISDAQTGGAVGLLGISLTFGLVITALATAFSPISGAHFNPAVTVAFWLVGKIRTIEGIRYIGVQIVGAILAGLALKLAFGGFDGEPSVYGFAGGATPLPSMGPGTPLLIGIEAMLTAVVVYAVLLAAADARAPQVGALYVGGAITACMLAGSALSGASMNPARWFGPALVYGDLSYALIYVAGPLVGAVAAALSVRYLYAER
ncbi:MAG: MIP/aquaporin family protein, partial [Candidatus Limnocylindrus sp.]